MPKKRPGPKFSKSTKQQLAEDAGFICSNPDCSKGTALGPTDYGARSKIGDAAHICGAQPGATRYNPDQTDVERAAKENGIFLCVECHDKIDADEQKYPAQLLHSWKQRHAQYISTGQDTEERKAGRLVLANLEEVLPMWCRESEARSRSLLSPFRLHPDTAKQLMESISIPENLEYTLRQAMEAEIGDKKRVILLTGDAGSGKSTYLGNVFRVLIRQFESVSTSRIPIMIQGLREDETLQYAIRERATLLGIKHLKAALICVDKLDELEPRTLRTALGEAEALTHSGDMIFLFATRPVLDAELPATTLPVPSLSTEDILRIASYSAQREVNEYEYSPQSIATKELLRRPLFALLFGFWLQRSPEYENISGTRLLAYLIEQVFSTFEGNRHQDASNILHRLAIASTDRGGEAVPIREVSSIEKRSLLTRTGLVTLDNGNLSFAIPLLTQWYGAEALLEGAILLEDILVSPKRSELWKYAIVFALIRGGGEDRQIFLSILTEHSPALASECILRAVSGFDIEPRRVLSWRTEAESLLHSLAAWSNGIGPLNRLLEPIESDRSIPSIVYIPFSVNSGIPPESEDGMTYHWTNASTTGETPLAIKGDVELLGDSHPMSPQKFYAIRGNTVPDLWAWTMTLDNLRSSLKDLIKNRVFSLSSSTDLDLEELWRHARRFVGLHWYQLMPVTRLAIQSKLDQHKRWAPDYRPSRRSRYSGEKSLIYEEWFLSRFVELECDFGDPWGDRIDTREASSSWKEYSTEQIIRRVELIFGAAISSYKSIVDQFFPKFVSRLLRYAELPVHLHVLISDRTLSEAKLLLTYYALPLPANANSIISASIDKSDHAYKNIIDDLNNRARQYQNCVSGRTDFYWNGRFSQQGFTLSTTDITPVSDLVYRWLSDDLLRVGWLSGRLKDEGFGTA